MPLNVFNRRQFGSIAASGVFMAGRSMAATETETPIAMIADTHIDADPEKTSRGVCMAQHLRQIVASILETMPNSAPVILNGDAAHLKGKPMDYGLLADLMIPLVDAGHSLHITMGNHDDRNHFYKAFADHTVTAAMVPDKHVSVIELPQANLVLLDSLWKVNVVTGRFNSAQLDWLDGWLANHRDRPAILFGHHHLQFDAAEVQVPTGVADTRGLLSVLARHPHARHYLHGHTHEWKSTFLDEVDISNPRVRLTNLPAAAYVFDPVQPSGWVRATCSETSMRLTLQTIPPDHVWNGQTFSLRLTSDVGAGKDHATEALKD
ncbi:MAG: metallophosphoesterase [Planctomycetota bacterium]